MLINLEFGLTQSHRQLIGYSINSFFSIDVIVVLIFFFKDLVKFSGVGTRLQFCNVSSDMSLADACILGCLVQAWLGGKEEKRKGERGKRGKRKGKK